MPVVSLPLTFNNSFWSQDYRQGLLVLYAKLQEGCVENSQIISFVNARAVAERDFANSLSNPRLTGPRGQGFDTDDGASLLVAFKGLQAESVKQAKIHLTISKNLEHLIIEPFTEWAAKHEERIAESRTNIIEGYLDDFDEGKEEVERLQTIYIKKARQAAEAEDDAKFAMDIGDKYTAPVNGSVHRSTTVSERIAQRITALRKPTDALNLKNEDKPQPTVPGEEIQRVQSPEPAEEKIVPKVDKGKGKAVDELPLPKPPVAVDIPEPDPILLGGLPLMPEVVNEIISRAKTELPLRPIRFPLLGEYQDCFSGLEFVDWIRANVKGLNGDLERAETFAQELTERENALRRLGEFGNRFDNSPEAYFQFKNKQFGAKRKGSIFTPVDALTSPRLSPAADTLVKTSRSFLSVVSQAVGQATAPAEPAFIRSRREADTAEQEYQVAIRKLDRQRLGLEERIEDTLKALQRWEGERLRAIKTVLSQYQDTLKMGHAEFQPTYDTSATLLTSFQPEQDLINLIERYKTGPFRPAPQVFESVDHERDVAWGVDLRQWAGEGGWNAIRAGEKGKEHVPPVLASLLSALKDAYSKLENDSERRKSWIYEVPLVAVHHLRENAVVVPMETPLSPELLSKYDAPVLAATIKLWFLELNPPAGTWEGWDEIRKIYPIVGAAKKEENVTERIDALKTALQKFPRIHLTVLDALVSHLKELIDSTEVETEARDIFTGKLAVSLARTILRPKQENSITIQDRHPPLFIIDLITHYQEILPPTIAAKKRESGVRPIPQRKRTRPVDVRMKRSRMSAGADQTQLLQAQLEARGGLSRNTSPTRQLRSPAPSTPAPIAVPPPGAVAGEENSTPRAPVFAEPKSDDDLPPRPTFAEPIEGDEGEPKASVVIEPPTPVARNESPPGGESHSPSRGDEGSTGATLGRSTSGESRPSRPRMVAKGPRAPGASAPKTGEYAPRKHGGAAAAGSFSRRTQESDAEDDVVGR